MSHQKTDASNNNAQTLVYCVIGGVVCCYFVPSYTIYFAFGGVICACAYGIINVLKKEEIKEDFNFVEKEKIEYFRKKQG